MEIREFRNACRYVCETYDREWLQTALVFPNKANNGFIAYDEFDDRYLEYTDGRWHLDENLDYRISSSRLDDLDALVNGLICERLEKEHLVTYSNQDIIWVVNDVFIRKGLFKGVEHNHPRPICYEWDLAGFQIEARHCFLDHRKAINRALYRADRLNLMGDIHWARLTQEGIGI